jgi:hypothetical protein
MTRNIQQWMTMISHNFYPETDDKKHPIIEGKCYIQYWMNKIIQYWIIIGDISLSIEKTAQ